MAWETRFGRPNLYRSRRVGGRVVKDYLGHGPAARVADSLAALDRRDRREQAEALAAQVAATEPLDRLMGELDEAAGRLLEATLLAHGYWRPNYTWMRRTDARRTRTD